MSQQHTTLLNLSTHVQEPSTVAQMEGAHWRVPQRPRLSFMKLTTTMQCIKVIQIILGFHAQSQLQWAPVMTNRQWHCSRKWVCISGKSSAVEGWRGANIVSEQHVVHHVWLPVTSMHIECCCEELCCLPGALDQ